MWSVSSESGRSAHVTRAGAWRMACSSSTVRISYGVPMSRHTCASVWCPPQQNSTFRRWNTLTVAGNCAATSPTVVSGKNVIRNLSTRLRVPPAAVVALAQPVLSEGLRPSDSPTRALARRFAGALPPPLKLRRDLAEAPTARRRADRVARSRCSLAPWNARQVSEIAFRVQRTTGRIFEIRAWMGRREDVFSRRMTRRRARALRGPRS